METAENSAASFISRIDKRHELLVKQIDDHVADCQEKRNILNRYIVLCKQALEEKNPRILFSALRKDGYKTVEGFFKAQWWGPNGIRLGRLGLKLELGGEPNTFS